MPMLHHLTSATRNTSGQCLCGAICLRASIVDASHACHCQQCRKWRGAVWMSVTALAIDWQKSEQLSVCQSSAFAKRGFCQHCGTGIFFALDNGDHQSLALGILSDKPALKEHFYCDQATLNAQHKPTIRDDIPRYSSEDCIARWNLPTRPQEASVAKIANGKSGQPVSGGCLCGKMCFQVQANAPLTSYRTCHSQNCQTLHSSYQQAVIIECDVWQCDFQDTLRWYHHPPHGKHGFCQECGSVLFWQSEADQLAAKMRIMAGAFDKRLPLPEDDHDFLKQASGAFAVPHLTEGNA